MVKKTYFYQYDTLTNFIENITGLTVGPFHNIIGVRLPHSLSSVLQQGGKRLYPIIYSSVVPAPRRPLTIPTPVLAPEDLDAGPANFLS